MRYAGPGTAELCRGVVFPFMKISNSIFDFRKMYYVSGSSRSFESSDSDPGLVKMINTMCPVQKHMELKEGAQVGGTIT